MANSVAPSFASATVLARHPTPVAFTEGAPWRRILAVEPDISVLNAKSLLLTKANYSVTKATGDRELFTLPGADVVALAILSDRLGHRLLGAVAEAVRRQLPRTRILVLGQAPMGLEDYLYDEQIHRSSDPQRVLDDLERLYEGMWNRSSNIIHWNGEKPARSFVRPQIFESDPTKTIQPIRIEERSLHGRPSGLRLPATRHH